MTTAACAVPIIFGALLDLTARALTKPRGYPGDYEVMRFFYERNFVGVAITQPDFCKIADADAKRVQRLKGELRNGHAVTSALSTSTFA